MSKEEFMKIQTCVLKVNIHCDGCKQKVKKILQKIEGVLTTKIDSEQGKVTVSGSVDPSVLIKKLAKSGKHAEIWGAPKGNNNPNQSQMANQFKGMQIDNNGKGGGGGGGGNNNNNKKGQKGGGGGAGGGNSNAPKMGQQLNPQQMQQLQKMKGFQDLKFPPQLKSSVPVNKNQNQKGVKFDVPEDDDDDDFSDEFDEFTDDDDDFDDEFDDLPLPSNKMKPNMMMPTAQQMMMNVQKNANLGGGPAKNGGKGVPGGGGGGGKGGPGGGGGGGGNQNQGGGKNGGGGGHPQDGKNGGGGGGGGPNGGKKGNGGGGPMAGGLAGGFRPMGGGGPPPNMSMPMGGPMGMGGPVGNIPAVQGLPATGPGGAPPGYFQGAGADPMQMQQQQQQQQYLAAVMNQQRAMGNERFQPMMYARPPPAVNYMPPNPHQYPNPHPYPYPYPYPPYGNDQYSHAFSDENTSSCDLM